MASGDFRKRFAPKSRRCRHYGDDGRVKRDPCPFKASQCHFVHPEDPEWTLTPIYVNTHADSYRDRGSSSKYHGHSRDFSPGRRDGGWGDRDGIKERERDWDRERDRNRNRDRERDRERDRGRDRSRSKERRRTYSSPARVRRESSIASSRSDAAPSTDISRTPVIPTEPAVLRTSKPPLQSPTPSMGPQAGKTSSSSSISVGANNSFRPPPPSSVTPPLPPPPPPPTADPIRSPTLPASWPTTVREPITPLTATSGSGFTLPPLPSSSGASTSSFTVPPPSSTISTTFEIPPSSASSIGSLQKENQRARILIKPLKPFNSHLASVSPIGAPSNFGTASAATAILKTSVTTSGSAAAQTGTTVSTTTTDQPLDMDISPAPATSFDAIPGMSPAGETPTLQMPPTPSDQFQPQLQKQSDIMLESFPPVPPLPPLPNFEQPEATGPELSNEAKIELWNKRTKAMAEILVLNEKMLRLTSDIDELKRYSTSPFLTSDPDDKKRVEANIAELEASRESARQAIQKGLDTLTGSDTWPSAPLVEQVQKDNEKMKEYVNELADTMKQVGETLKELADTAAASAGKGRKRRKRVKGKEKVGEKEKDEGTEKERELGEVKEPLTPSDAMVVDEVSPPTETNNVIIRSKSDEEDDTLIQPDELDEIRARFTSLNELWQSISDSLGQAESDWMDGVKELYQDLVHAQKRTIHSRIKQHKSQVDQHATRLKSDLSQVDTKIETVSKNIDGMVDETTQALETILKLREERDTLLADQQKFFKEELPDYKARFVAYDTQREKDQKRFGALEAALNAYVNRPPSPQIGNTISPIGSLDTLAGTGSTSSLPTSISSTTAASASSTTNTNTSHLDTKLDASDYPLAFNNIKPQLINLLRESVKPLVEEIRKQVEEMMNAQKEEMYTNMWSKIEFTWQVLAKVQKTTEVDIGALLASVNVNGDGNASRGENGAAAADMIIKAARDAGPHLADIPMDTGIGPDTSVPMASAAHRGGARPDIGSSMAGPNASAGDR